MSRSTLPRVALMALAIALPCSAIANAMEDRNERPALADLASQRKAFLASRSAAERKVPVSVAQQWQEDPETFNALRTLFGRHSTSSQIAPEERALYRVDAVSAAAIETALGTLGVTPKFVSQRRPYATVELTVAQIQVLAESEDVTRISAVIGPRAKGNASLAHDISALSTGNASGGGDLSGSGVVIGLISLPFSASLLSELETATAVPTEASGNLIILGDAKVTCDPGADPGPDPCAGLTADALNMLQVIYQIAPGAQVVMGSPGITSEPGEMATLVDAMVAGDVGNSVPAANIILDDLYYPSQNPFEVDEISEAITDARANGVLYLTAAGDGGHYAETDSTSSVYVADVESVSADGTAAQQLDSFLVEQDTIHNFGGDTLTTVAESLADVCLFSDQNPDFSTSALTAWIYDETDAFVGSIDGVGCLSQDDPESALPLEADSSIVVLVNTVGGSSRVMLTSERAAVPADLVFTAPTMSKTTAGNILGHAYAPGALTIAAADLCVDEGNNDAVQNYSDDSVCPTISIAPYSADGEGADVPRFYWQMDSESNWQQIDEGLAVAKPSVTALGKESVQLWDGNALASGDFIGTSASVAAASGIAALYWEYRGASETDVNVLSVEVATALQESVTGAGADILFGSGVLNASAAVAPLSSGNDAADKTLFDEPLPVQNLSMMSVPGGVELDFDKALDDVADPAVFEYSAVCGESPADDTLLNKTLYASDADGGVPNETKVPLFIASAEEVFCSVTPRRDSTANVYSPSSLNASAESGGVAPVTVSMTAKAAGAVMSFSASDLEATETVTYSATCFAGDEAISGWSPKTDVVSETDYIFQQPVGTEVTCGVTVNVLNGGGDITSSTETTASATAGAVTAATASVTADSGGIIVRWTPDPNLASADMASGTVRCVNAETDAEVVNQALSGASTFVEAEAGVALSCSVTTVISINGVGQTPTTTSSTTVTPEEELASGLPIWLLYQATQGSGAEEDPAP